jgi:hypothetical protein
VAASTGTRDVPAAVAATGMSTPCEERLLQAAQTNIRPTAVMVKRCLGFIPLLVGLRGLCSRVTAIILAVWFRYLTRISYIWRVQFSVGLPVSAGNGIFMQCRIWPSFDIVLAAQDRLKVQRSRRDCAGFQPAHELMARSYLPNAERGFEKGWRPAGVSR